MSGSEKEGAPGDRQGSMRRPLRHRSFREIWMSSLFSNLGLLILGVAAAWSMTSLSDSAQDVGLVQTTLMLPFLFLAIPAGAIADSYDKRLVAMIALIAAIASNAMLTTIAIVGGLTPTILLSFCLLTGCANSMFAPSWQSSVPEQVPVEDIGNAVALNSISFNIARSFGPAVGGVIVATIGAASAFGITALLYLPAMVAFFRWKRVPEPPRFPPERVARATVSGIRYIIHSSAMRAVMLRTAAYCIAGSSIVGLMPLISKELLGGDALTYGIMLAVFGIGAVIGAVYLGRLQAILPSGWHTEIAAAIVGLCVLVLAGNRIFAVSLIALLIAGIGWTQLLTSLNIAVQVGAPRWVAGRVLAAFQATAAGGFAVGSWFWGYLAELTSIPAAVAASGIALIVCAAAGRFVKGSADLPDPTDARADLSEPEIALAITANSGPVSIELEYRIAPGDARSFYERMQEVGRIRKRNGAFDWRLRRNLADASQWKESFQFPTWQDYLRQRGRLTVEEYGIFREISRLRLDKGPVRAVRYLERPVGSVRWSEDTPDRGVDPVSPRLP